MSAYVHEYKCGCIIHQLAGVIRKCPGIGSRSCSGRAIPKPDNAEKRHNDTMDEGKPVKVWEVANILP